jgi:hypothetical protein
LTSQFIEESEEQDFDRYYFESQKGVYVFKPGIERPVSRNYKLDEAEQKLSILGGNDSSKVLSGSYEIVNDSTLAWDIEEGEKRIYLIRKKLQ